MYWIGNEHPSSGGLEICSHWSDTVCIYCRRSRTNPCRKLRLDLLFSEAFDVTYSVIPVCTHEFSVLVADNGGYGADARFRQGEKRYLVGQ